MAVFVVLHGDQWAVKTDNSERAYKVFDTQLESNRLWTGSCAGQFFGNAHTELNWKF